MSRGRGQFPLFPEGVSEPTLRDVADAVRVAGIEGLPGARERADRARYQEVRVRSGLAEARGMPFRWTLNPYRGCTHACEYCYARKYQRHLELGAGDDFSTVILVKTNLAGVLRRELQRPAWRRELVAVGTATDPYQPIEGHYRLTRAALGALADSGTPFNIVTKGPMVVRDADLIAHASRTAPCRVFVSVPSVDEDAWRRLEPGTASPAQRLRAVRELTAAGVDAGVLMMPLVPGITTSRGSVERTLGAITRAGARFVGANVAHFEDGVRAHFFAFLAREYPALVDGYERLYTRSRAPDGYVREITSMVKAAASRLEVAARQAAARPASP